MSLGLCFWIIMVVWAVFGFVINRPTGWALGGSLLEFVLFLLVGWGLWGAPIHG